MGFFPEPNNTVGQTSSKEPNLNRWGSKSVSSRMDVTQLTATPKPVPSIPSDTTKSGNRDRGTRSITRTEWEERRKKGLCFHCGLQYRPTHKCVEGQLRVLLLGDEEEDNAIEDQFRLMESYASEHP